MKRNLQLLAWMMPTVLSLTLTLRPATAQEPNAGGLEIVELSGKLEMILGNQIKMKTGDGQETIVLVGDDTNFSYQGTAEPTALVPRLMVRFTAAFDAAGTPQAPLTELEIFRPMRMRRMPMEVRQRQTVGIHPVTERDQEETPAVKAPTNRRADDKTAAAKPTPNNPRDTANTRKAAKPRSTDPAATVAAGNVQEYLVVGMLGAMQGDKLQIIAGNRPVIVTADPNLSITVSSGDPMFCQPGDDIKLTGLKNPAGLIQAETIEVTGAKPLGSMDEKVQARNARASKRGKPGEADAADPKDPKTPATEEKPKSR